MGRTELMMPRVMVPLSPKGLPMAKTFCPTTSDFESPSVAATRSGALIWITARSCERSRPITVALYFFLLCRVTSTSRALAIT